jgi:hypothetical protein
MVTPNGPNFGVNFDPNNRSVYKSQPTKNFEKVLRKERQEERQQDDGKKFKKMDESDVTAKEDFEKFLAQEDIELAHKAASSIFDMDAKSEHVEGEEPQEGDTVLVKEMPPEMHKESLSALFQGLGTKEKLATMQKEVSAERPLNTETDFVSYTVPEKAKTTSTSTSTVFMHEQPDLTSVNPAAAMQISTVDTSKTVSPTPIKTNNVDMQDLVDQMVKQITIMTTAGKTDTTIVLKQPPLFAGANLTVTTFDTAKGQFNITFENLSQAAKQLIDMSENQTALRSALEQKGYMVHILVASTTTLEERPVIVKGEQLDPRRDGEQSQDEDKKERKRRG